MEPIDSELANFQPFNNPLENQTDTVKNKIHGCIQNDEYDEFKELMATHNVDPHEELSVKGYKWTGIHYAAHFKRPKFLEYYIRLAYKNYRKDFVGIMNIKTSEGWTPAMICSIYKSLECLEILYKFGGLKPNLTDKDGRTQKTLAEYYASIECYEFLNQQSSTNDVSINHEAFNTPFIETDPVIPNQDLLMNGIRSPCIFCNSNKGYLRYCRWCGMPVHKICLRNNNATCKCGKTGGEITSEILYPEKAFTLEENQAYMYC